MAHFHNHQDSLIWLRYKNKRLIRLTKSITGVDPGFPVGGGADPPGEGGNIQFCQNFQKIA